MATRCTVLTYAGRVLGRDLVLGRDPSGSPTWSRTSVWLPPCGTASLRNHRPAVANAEVFPCCSVHTCRPGMSH